MAFKYQDYQESDKVKKYASDIAAQEASKPSDWTGGQYGQAMNDALSKIQNREKFSYDLNGDALYQQYKDKYITLGKQAMQDTMGQAAALTGGYSSTYAQSAGQQQYDAYLQSLNDVVPELYQMAYDRYNQEGQDMYNQYSLLSDQYNNEYGRYRDTVSDWQSQRNYLADQYNTERNYDYTLYGDAKNFAYTDYRNQISDQQWAAQMAYQRERDAVADAQWQKEYDLAASQVSGSSSGSSSGSGGYTTYDTHGYTTEQIKSLQKAAGITQDGIWGKNTQAAYEAGYRPTSGYSTYSSAVSYMTSNGVSNASASGIMTQSEWQRRKNAGSTSASVANYATYQDYLNDIVEYKTKYE